MSAGDELLVVQAPQGREHEFYPTPVEAIDRYIASDHADLPGGRWIDPCAGAGAIPRAVNAVRCDVDWTLIELDERHRRALDNVRAVSDLWIADALSSETDVRLASLAAWLPRRSWDVALFNPPFSMSLAFVRLMLNYARHVVMLQRVAWFGPARSEWLRQHAPDLYVLPVRPSFTGGGTDKGQEYGWYRWDRAALPRRAGRLVMLDEHPLQRAMF